MRHRLLLLAGLALAGCATGPVDTTPQAPGGYSGSLRITPNPVLFEDTPVGCEGSVALTLQNVASEAGIVVASVTAPNGSLRVSGTLPMALPAGGESTLELRFVPGTSGDWSGIVRFTTAEGGVARYPLQVQAVAEEPVLDQIDMAEVQPLDLVFVLDISTTMYEMTSLRKAIASIFDFVEAQGVDARFGLTTFENDVLVHRQGAFLEREEFFRELDSQLVEGQWIPNPQLPRQLLNFDLQENMLDALHRSATSFDFREGARRYLLLMTDDTFLEAPAVFSDGTPALHTYSEVATTLASREMRLFAVHASKNGQGLSSDYGEQSSLVSLTEGNWFELSAVSSGRLTLDTLLSDLVVGSSCN